MGPGMSGNNPEVSQVYRAIKNAINLGDMPEFTKLLEKYGDVNYEGPRQNSLAYLAIMYARPEMLEKILEAGFRVNDISGGKTALYDDAIELCSQNQENAVGDISANINKIWEILNRYGAKPRHELTGNADAAAL